jgi:hypothetical protein
MAFDKLIDALNDFRGEYVRELTNSGGSSAGSEEPNIFGSAWGVYQAGVQPKVKLFGQIYRMQITHGGIW